MLKKRNLFILGLSGKFCDPGAALFCVLPNRKVILLGAVEEEKVYHRDDGTREKHHEDIIPRCAIEKLISRNGLLYSDIDEIAVSFDRNLFIPKNKSEKSEMMLWFEELIAKYKLDEQSKKLWLERINKKLIPKTLEEDLQQIWESHRAKLPKINYFNHHYCHALSSCYMSGFKGNALVVTSDAVGEKASATVWLMKLSTNNLKPKMLLIEEIILPNSLGHYYAAMTEFLGFKPLEEEGQLMGLSPYGKPKNGKEKKLYHSFRNIIKKVLKIDKKGNFFTDPYYLYYGRHSHGERFSDKFWEEMSPFIKGKSLIYKNNNDLDYLFPTRKQEILAFVIQERFEEAVISYIKKHLSLFSKEVDYLCLAGGTFLNCVVNGKIVSLFQNKLKWVKDVYIQPCSTDAGGSLGAGLASIEKRGYNPLVPMKHAYWGFAYSDKEIKKELLKFKDFLIFGKTKNKKEIIDFTLKNLCQGEPVAWFDGKMEWGPRALGNRSLLINISDPFGNYKANRLKGRQSWRPSACSIAKEDADYYLEKGFNNSSAPFMIVSSPVKKKFLGLLRSGIHQADLTTRFQSVDKSYNYLFWLLLKKMKKKIGLAAVLNTSFNRKGQPLVDSPRDAIIDFLKMPGILFMRMGSFLIKKKKLTKDWCLMKDRIILEIKNKEISLKKEKELDKFLSLLTPTEIKVMKREFSRKDLRNSSFIRKLEKRLAYWEGQIKNNLFSLIGNIYWEKGVFKELISKKRIIKELSKKDLIFLQQAVRNVDIYLHPGLKLNYVIAKKAKEYIKNLFLLAISKKKKSKKN